MKVALINGQNHKGSTYNIGKILALKLTDEENIKEVFLPRDMPKFCVGCTSCFMKSETLCPHYELVHPIDEIIHESDVLIFTTPTYVFHSSGSMKAFLDHFGYRWLVHRPEAVMFKKQAVCISTAAGGGMKKACKDIKDSLDFWGIPKTYIYGRAVYVVKWNEVSEKVKAKIEKKTDVLARKLKKHEGKTRVNLKTRIYFYGMRFAQKRGGLNKADVDYWKEQGYTDKVRPWKS